MKILKLCPAGLISSLIFSITFAQTQPTPQSPAKENSSEPEEVFRINTQLVQVDAVVTDKKNVHIDDLKESDFEIYVDGKKQNLTYFRLVKLDSPALTLTTESIKSPASKTTPPANPLKQLKPEEIHRTIALVVDDLGLSFGSIDATRDALRKFVNTQMQENDLVAIIQTGKGLGSLQQFTSDKRILNAAIDKLRWNPNGRDLLPSFGRKIGEQESASGGPIDDKTAERTDDFRETVFAVGTLGAVNFVIRGLRELPGRKMIMLFSDGFRLSGRNHDNSQAMEDLRRLTDLANRSSVVIYTIDARGLVVVAPTAADDVRAKEDFNKNIQNEVDQNQMLRDSQEGLITLAQSTGGFANINGNDLNLGIKKVLQDNQSYYLLGFDPDDEQFAKNNQNKFHAIKIKVNRPGLEVRTRSGYFGVPETAAREVPKTREQQILHAVFSPFGTRDLSVQMTSLFFNTQQGKSFVRSFLHVDPDKLKFVDLPTGEKELTLDVATFAFDENGKAIESHAKLYNLKFNKTQYEMALKNGLSYDNDTPIQKPGSYQFKMVLRDVGSEKLGSAGQFIHIPDISKNQLALSGVTLVGKPRSPGEAISQSSNSARKFSRNAKLEYWLFIYNAQQAKESQPKVSVKSEIYRDGKPIFQSQSQEIPLTGQPDLKRLICGGEVNITNLQPGDYLLHIIVTDPLAKAKYTQADQWIDFSIQ